MRWVDDGKCQQEGYRAACSVKKMESFQGDCPLAGQVIWTSQTNFELGASDGLRCMYIVGIQAVAAAVAFVYVLYRVISLCCGRFDFSIMRIICVPLYSIMAILILGEAAVVSHGLNALCDGFRSLQVVTANYDCELFQQVNWHIYDGSGFYEDFSKAEKSGWVSFLAWVSLVAVGVLHCVAERPESGFTPPNNAK
ncbi:transmembrane protein 179-like isoform X2 [Acanthaster planci]|uniref:Transmembrane protein 179-like isoform X2 n=1 Tax=Acanthaster planci TaxID=133434 RepID=A0A8B7Y544_ACAPL|nr:transmembrane protein 179-like isoform X2 [Acanthaster planci]